MVVSQVVTMLLDARRARREAATRWHAERRHVYASFAAKIEKQIVEITLKWEGGALPMSFLSDLLEEAKAAHIEVELIGTKPVRDAADALWDGLARGGDQAMSGGKANDLTVDDFLRDTRSLLRAFVGAGREELGVQ
ncbi:hypothetical protein D7147_21800 [Micromonospora musae]|uniref:Uncharacterized protein n=1 Tax=Micromonospora musae TaxID=1894970 RepID=A0ABX9R2X3_9ACTN|nr:hypothetical protein D7147_21800 [Micromonospora musae]